MAQGRTSAPGRAQAATKRTAAASATAKKAPAKKAPATKAPAKKASAPSAAKKTPARAAPVKKATAKVPAKAPAKTPAKTPAKKAPVKVAAKAPAKAAPAKKTTATAKAAAKAPAKAPAKKASSKRLVVRADESPWTAKELAEVRQELEAEQVRLDREILSAEEGLADLLRDSGDGAGDDQADAGTKTFEREHEMSLANNARDMHLQTERALRRIEDGTYGVCESCGNPIGKGRLQAFPRATLCLSCKQREERR